ncbi:TIGR00270 family protein, partial [Candidatus Bathyarchaeota archaeon]|nr:TIGR00270 family protein [Candidatus Bathyarchaeota archaeon]
MHCEVCGQPIVGKPYRVIIERAKMTTCARCAELGSTEWKPEPPSQKSVNLRERDRIGTTFYIKKRETTKVSEDIVITEGFGLLVRRAREKMGLSHEDLGRKIAEKVSVIKKIESEKMVPDQRVAEKLERFLGIKLLVPLIEPKIPNSSTQVNKTVTLGEIVKLKDAKWRNQKNESDH